MTVTLAEVRVSSRRFCQSVRDLDRLRQAAGDLSSVRLTTPGGELRGAYALDTFEALRLREVFEACAAEPEEGEA
jgi:hypothetical protein